jgi:plasmid stability protein
LTIQVSDEVYERLRRRANQAHQSIEAQAAEVLAQSAAPPALPRELADTLAQMTLMQDDELWRAARTTLTARERARLESLHLKRQREGLSGPEAEESAELARKYDRALLVRSQALALLKERGHDISPLLQQP